MPMTVDEEIRELRGQLGSDPGKNEIILERIGLLERQLEAQRIADAHRANETATQQARDHAREQRRAERERFGLTVEGVRRRLAELAAEERQIEAAINEIDARKAALRHQAEQERPDLVGLFHATSEAKHANTEREALGRRLWVNYRERVELSSLVEEHDEKEEQHVRL